MLILPTLQKVVVTGKKEGVSRAATAGAIVAHCRLQGESERTVLALPSFASQILTKGCWATVAATQSERNRFSRLSRTAPN